MHFFTPPPETKQNTFLTILWYGVLLGLAAGIISLVVTIGRLTEQSAGGPNTTLIRFGVPVVFLAFYLAAFLGAYWLRGWAIAFFVGILAWGLLNLNPGAAFTLYDAAFLLVAVLYISLWRTARRNRQPAKAPTRKTRIIAKA